MKRKIGLAMVAAPFVAIFVGMIITEGVLFTAGFFAAMLFTFLWMKTAIDWLMS